LGGVEGDVFTGVWFAEERGAGEGDVGEDEKAESEEGVGVVGAEGGGVLGWYSGR